MQQVDAEIFSGRRKTLNLGFTMNGRFLDVRLDLSANVRLASVLLRYFWR